ncbi:unnamed protein product [Protopolystoma xenopodis]|uniref:Uncharacterized protein n=1 Tax=Protopolystoma xenopodis TaxID=117903 RepID=A0A448XRS5_9PLAT|nr:unnamed protein product [Protopolystoma xenopodis]VEL43341.1 unnamed protein product [Protopolystoma xenopodis]
MASNFFHPYFVRYYFLRQVDTHSEMKISRQESLDRQHDLLDRLARLLRDNSRHLGHQLTDIFEKLLLDLSSTHAALVKKDSESTAKLAEQSECANQGLFKMLETQVSLFFIVKLPSLLSQIAKKFILLIEP